MKSFKCSQLARESLSVISYFKKHFGGCPQCRLSNGFRSIGRDHWYYCDEHRMKWWIGSNLFSSWRVNVSNGTSQSAWKNTASVRAEPIANSTTSSLSQARDMTCNANAHRTRHKGLCRRDPRDGRERGTAYGQVQKLTAGKFHFELSLCLHIIRSPRRRARAALEAR